LLDVQATSAALKAPITAASNAWLPPDRDRPLAQEQRVAPRLGSRVADRLRWRRRGAREDKDTAGAGRQVDIGVIRAARVQVQLADARHRLGDVSGRREHVHQLVEVPARRRVLGLRPLPFPASGEHRDERDVPGTSRQLVHWDPSPLALFEQPSEDEVAHTAPQR
jgi:hypothetical protein